MYLNTEEHNVCFAAVFTGGYFFFLNLFAIKKNPTYRNPIVVPQPHDHHVNYYLTNFVRGCVRFCKRCA